MPKRPKPIELKWPVWFLIVPVLAWICLGTWNELSEAYWDRQYIKLGKAVDCRTRPSPDYLRVCNPASDGVACSNETSTRLANWHAPIDYACAQYEPDRVFRFPVNNGPETLEVAEVG